MPRTSRNRRLELVADKIMDWGNLLFVGFVIGQFVPGTAHIQWSLLLVGVFGMVCAYLVANQLMKGVIRS